MLCATVHSTKHHAEEIANTMNLLHIAIHNTLSDDFHPELKNTLEEIQRKKAHVFKLGQFTTGSKHHIIKLRMKQKIEEDQYNLIQEMFQCNEIELYHIVFIGATRFTTRKFAKAKKNDDSCIFYQLKGRKHVGFIDKILLIDKQAFLKIKTVSIKGNLNCIYGTRMFHCQNVSFGSINNHQSDLFIKVENVIEKLIYYQETNNAFFFFRFPTLLESS